MTAAVSERESEAGTPATGARARGPRRKRPSVAWKVTSWLVVVLAAFVCRFVFFVLNRTRVRRGSVTLGPNTLLVSNHQSSLDAFVVALAANSAGSVLRPSLHPWNLAAAEFFFSTPARAWFAGHLRCIPVAPGRRDPVALRRLIAALREGVAIVFPEGRRSPDGELLPAEPGVGMLVLATAPHIIPVAIDGTGDVVRFDRFGLRPFRTIGVSVGEPVDLSEFRGRRPDRATAQAIANRIHSAIRAELETARALRRGLPPVRGAFRQAS